MERHGVGFHVEKQYLFYEIKGNGDSKSNLEIFNMISQPYMEPRKDWPTLKIIRMR